MGRTPAHSSLSLFARQGGPHLPSLRASSWRRRPVLAPDAVKFWGKGEAAGRELLQQGDWTPCRGPATL